MDDNEKIKNLSKKIMENKKIKYIYKYVISKKDKLGEK